MRDGIVPVDHTRLLPLKIIHMDKKSEALLMKSGVLMIPGWLQREMHRRSKKKYEISANLKIQNILGKGEEYELIVILASGKNKIRYYTRLMQTQNDDTQALYGFCHCSFHEYTFRG